MALNGHDYTHWIAFKAKLSMSISLSIMDHITTHFLKIRQQKIIFDYFRNILGFPDLVNINSIAEIPLANQRRIKYIAVGFVEYLENHRVISCNIFPYDFYDFCRNQSNPEYKIIIDWIKQYYSQETQFTNNILSKLIAENEALRDRLKSLQQKTPTDRYYEHIELESTLHDFDSNELKTWFYLLTNEFDIDRKLDEEMDLYHQLYLLIKDYNLFDPKLTDLPSGLMLSINCNPPMRACYHKISAYCLST
jgi:hypothetical protein